MTHDFKTLPLFEDKEKTPFYDTPKGQIFLADRMTTFCRTELIEEHIRKIHEGNVVTVNDDKLMVKLVANPETFRKWIRQPDKPSDEHITDIISKTYWTDTHPTGQPKYIKKFFWVWEDPQDIENTTWMFGINDFLRMPDKYKRDLKEQNSGFERHQREQVDQRRRQAAPNVQDRRDP